MTTTQDIDAAFTKAVEHKSLCSLGRKLEENENGPLLAERVADSVKYPAAVIARVFNYLGLGPLSYQQVNRHRRRECRCYINSQER